MRLPSILGLLAATLFVGCAPAPAKAQPPVWVVRDADSEIVLFGSIHVLPPGLDWTPPALAAAITAADDLWFELPIDVASEAQVAQLAAANGFLPEGQSLSALLSPAGRARLERIYAKYQASPAVIERLEPWYAEVALAGLMYQAAGANAGAGVEKTLSARAPASAARRAFETPAQQIGFFDGTALEDQVASLEETLREMEEKPKAFDDMVRAWVAGDIGALDREALQPLKAASPRLYARLVTARNAAWVTKLQVRLKGRGKTVVVVGVGHLIGADGVPARLRALGYSVEGP